MSPNATAPSNRRSARQVLAGFASIALLAGGCTFDDVDPPRISLEEVRDFADELNDFWSQVAPELGITYTPVPRERVTDGTTGATCDGEEVDPDGEDIVENAFVDGGCAEGILVAADLYYLDDSPLNMEMTLSHEWGHVVQAQAPQIDAATIDGLDIDAELQADCFSGAWAGGTLSPADLVVARARVAETGDEDGVEVDDPDAHGTADERVAAFQLGVERGATACVGDELYEVLPA